MIRPNRAINRHLAIIIVSLTVVACSRVELAYENADQAQSTYGPYRGEYDGHDPSPIR